jgi:hypothetical protein
LPACMAVAMISLSSMIVIIDGMIDAMILRVLSAIDAKDWVVMG